MAFKYRSLGVYVGFGDASWNLPACVEQMAKDGVYNGLVLHLISPFNGTDYPWQRNGNIFTLTKKNPGWFTRLDELAQACGENHIALHPKFFDVYQDASHASWIKNWPYVPFRHNTFNKQLSAQMLYDSWASQHGQTVFGWVSWTDDHGKLYNFKPVAPFGGPIIDNYLNPSMEIFADKINKFSLNLIYSYANECLCTSDGNGGWVHGGKSIGAGPEVQTYFKELWADHGMVSPLNPWKPSGLLKKFLESYNWMAVSNGSAPTPKYPSGAQDLIAFKKGFDSNRKVLKTTIQEMHSIDYPPLQTNDCTPESIYAAGLNPKLVLLSRDGTKELPLDSKSAAAKKMYQGGAPLVDTKPLWEPFTWSNQHMQVNWDHFYPYSVKMVQ
jgi:hypothetical protein